MSDVLLRPEEFRYGRLRPPSRLSMNSLRSALTAVLAGQNPLAIRAKEDYERAFTRRTEHYNQTDASANVRKNMDTTITVTVSPSKVGNPVGLVGVITLADGTVLQADQRVPKVQ